MNSTHYHIPMEQMMEIQNKLNDKDELDLLAKSFKYDQSLKESENLYQLGTMIIKYLELQGKSEEALRQYLVQKNIPIQVTFRPLKVEQLLNILQEWISCFSETSTIVEKIYSNNHRNILFRRVLFQDKETINDYFSTLSERNMLKGVNLYQLLVQLLSRYYLYEYNSDALTFFDKINSFNSFIEVVQKFIHSEKRISLGTSQKDHDYVRRIQFERLIQFWEEVNPELTLLSEQRINKFTTEVQTTFINSEEKDVQTQRQQDNLMNFINGSLQKLNRMTINNQNLQELMIIQNIYSNLRKEKINLLSLQQQGFPINVHPPSPLRPNHLGNLVDSNQSQPTQILKLIDKQDLELDIARTVSPNTKQKQTLLTIYNLYKEITGFSIDILQNCFIDIGIVEQRQSSLIRNLEQKKVMKNRDHITYDEFKTIFHKIMQNDRELTFEVLEEFASSCKSKRKCYQPGANYFPKRHSPRKASQYIPKSSRSFMGKYLDTTFKY